MRFVGIRGDSMGVVGCCPLFCIQGAVDGEGAGVHDVGVDHGGAHVFVAEEFLDGADAVAGFEEVGGEGVAEDVGGDAFGHSCALCGVLHGFLDDAGVQMVATHDAGARVLGDARGGKDVLPAPFAGGVGVFAGQGVGQEDFAITGGHVFVVEDAHLAEMFL